MTSTDRAMCTEAEDRIRELEADHDRLARAVKDWQAHTTDAQEEAAELRAGVSWARGMCSDGRPVEEIDHFLGCVLAGKAQLEDRRPTPAQVEKVCEIHQSKRAVRGPEPKVRDLMAALEESLKRETAPETDENRNDGES